MSYTSLNYHIVFSTKERRAYFNEEQVIVTRGGKYMPFTNYFNKLIISSLMFSFLYCFGYGFAGEKERVIGQSKLRRVLSLVDDRWCTVRFENKFNNQKLATEGPEFVLTWGEGQEVTSDDFTLLSVDVDGPNTTATLENNTLGLQAEIIYTVASEHPWLYKQIKFINMGTRPFLLRTVELEHLKVLVEKITYAVDPTFPRRPDRIQLSDWGQPVYTQSLWFGVEFPAVRSSATTDGFIFLRHHPGISLAAGQSYLTKRAVMGAALRGKTREFFMDYVATLPHFQPAPQMRLNWNGFRVIKGPDRLRRNLEMLEHAKKLKAETNFTFAAWSYDAGFDMYRADALFEPVEADLWEKTYEMLKPLETPLGFWVGFSSIFCTKTHPWGKTQGYELQHAQSYCLAGPTYFAAIKNRLEDIVEKYQMGSINFDGMYWGQGFGCNEQGHGHLTGSGGETGVYATERVVENKIEIFQSLRKINPTIILNFFVCNKWASPWWLMAVDGVHTVAGDTLPAGIPSPWLRDELITARDIQVFNEHRKVGRQFPLWAVDLYGTQVRKDHIIDYLTVTGESKPERWEDEYVMALPGRGAITTNVMCSDLEVIGKTQSGLKFLGEVANWTQANEGIYRDYHLIGGDPNAREVYGYSHCDSKGRALVALRNPYIIAKDFPLVINASLGLKKTADKYYVNVVYPYRKTYEPVDFGATVNIPLQDYQVMLLEVRTQPRQYKEIDFSGRWSVNRSDQLIQYDESALDDLPKGALNIKRTGDESHLVGKVSVPDKAEKGQIQIMFGWDQKFSSDPIALIDGNAVATEFHERSGRVNQDWLLIDIPPGRHIVDVSFCYGEGKIKLGGWMTVHYVLNSNIVSQKEIETSTLFPVFAENKDRRMIILLEDTEIGDWKQKNEK